MKVYIKKFLNQISKAIYTVIPKQFKNKTIYDLYVEEEKKKCFDHFKKYFKSSIFLPSREIREYAIKKSIEQDPNKNFTYLEFGVGGGLSINYFADFVNKIYGFDSFKGLNEDWLGFTKAKGTFAKIYKELSFKSNVIIVKGLVQETLEKFLLENNPKINFVHMDMDTYKTSKYILEKIKPYLNKNSIILFDQLYNFSGWDVGEYKALKEVFDDKDYIFKAFSSDNRRVVIEIN